MSYRRYVISVVFCAMLQIPNFLPGKISFPFLLLIAISAGTLAQQQPSTHILSGDSIKSHFNSYQVTGTIVVEDLKNKRTYIYDKARAGKRYSPASTFKIFNSLVGLETGVIPDTSYVIAWDSVQRGKYAPWHRANSLRSAFKYSVVWYYQELARRVGAESMKKFVTHNSYGNGMIGPAVDVFWLQDSGGQLRISPVEQIAFLKKLYAGNLTFSKRSVDLVKEIMLQEDKQGVRLLAKTGMDRVEGETIIGWYVGWLESQGNVYFFATLVEADDAGKILSGARKGVTIMVLEDLNIVKKGTFNY